MSAFGTKKPGSDEAIQLGFPEVFAATYAQRRGPTPQYTQQSHGDYSSDSGAGSDTDSDSDVDMGGLQLPLPVGQDVQDRYHEQKRLDANHMAMAGVHARRMSDRRANSSHNGFFGMPKPVLSQRRFANPSNGNQADIYAARNDLRGGSTVTVDTHTVRTTTKGAGDCYETQIRGGVRTAEGQTFAKRLLMNRVGQLDTIEKNKAAFLNQMPTEETPSQADIDQGLPENVGKNTMLELNALLQQIADAVYGGLPSVNRYALSDLTRALSLLFRVATVANAEELDDLVTLFNNLYTDNDLEFQIEQEQEKDLAHRNLALVRSGETMLELIDRTRQYVTRMLGAVNRSQKERARLSSTLVRDLKFSKLGKLGKDLEEALRRPPAAAPPPPVQPGEDGEGFPGPDDEDDADDDEGPPGLLPPEEGEVEAEFPNIGANVAAAEEEEEEGEGEEEEEAVEEAPPPAGDGLGSADGLNAIQRQKTAAAELEAIRYMPKGARAALITYRAALGMPPPVEGQRFDSLIKDTFERRKAIKNVVGILYKNPFSKAGEGAGYTILGEFKVGERYGEPVYRVLNYTKKSVVEKRLVKHLRDGNKKPGPVIPAVGVPGLVAEGRFRQPREARPVQRDTRPATQGERAFSHIPLPSEKAEQLDTLHSRGLKLRDVKYSHDERNDFARKSGAYMGEELPEGGDNVEMPSKYPILKASGMAKAMRRDTAEPTFAGGYTPSTLKKKLGGQRMTGFPAQGKLGVYNGQPEMMGRGIIDDVKKHAKKLYNMGRYAINPMATAVRDAKHLYAKKYTPRDLPKERTYAEYFSGKGKMSRADLPKTREGFVKLAEELKGHGTIIRVNSGSALKNIRQNFIRKLGL
jgi:hypothetical protein